MYLSASDLGTGELKYEIDRVGANFLQFYTMLLNWISVFDTEILYLKVVASVMTQFQQDMEVELLTL